MLSHEQTIESGFSQANSAIVIDKETKEYMSEKEEGKQELENTNEMVKTSRYHML